MSLRCALDEKADILSLVSKALKSERGAWMTELTYSMDGMFVKDTAWSTFLTQIGKYIKTERGDKIVYHDLIASATKRLATLEGGGTNSPPS